MVARCAMRRTDVFQGARESARLRRLLVPEAVDQSGCVGQLMVSAVEAMEVDLAEVRERLTAVEARSESTETAPKVCEYLLYLATPGGYRLTEAHGLLPAAGDPVGAANATVLRIGPSPLPDDPRPCVFALGGPPP